MRGFGNTLGWINIKGGYNHATDLVELLDELQVAKGDNDVEDDKRVHLVGCGLGGNVALDTAFAFPKRIASVSCVCSGLEGHKWNSYHYLQIGRILENEDVEEYKQEWMRFNRAWRLVHDDSTSKVTKLLKKIAEDYKGQHLLTASRLNRVHLLPTMKRLEYVDCPVLAVGGVNDTPQFKKIVQEIFEGVRIKGSVEPIFVDKASHWLTLEQPVVLKKLLEDHWKSAENMDPLEPSARPDDFVIS